MGLETRSSFREVNFGDFNRRLEVRRSGGLILQSLVDFWVRDDGAGDERSLESGFV